MPMLIKNESLEYKQGFVDGKQYEKNNINGDTSDGYHTFNELYHHRTILFSVICNQHPDLAWKSLQHDDPHFPMYDGMFIVGINTPDGQATYHCDLKYWDMFKVPELDRAPKFDGHTPTDAIERISRIIPVKSRNKCDFPNGIKIKPDGINDLDPCVYIDTELHTNVNVLVSKCKNCGNIDISWSETENTEHIYYEH